MKDLTHLKRLEAESIHIMREVVAECDNPVMLYSIGKDSSVMLHLALKAFYPAKPPFPFLHVDTTWKFREMIKFRDETAKRLGLELLVYTNADRKSSPRTHATSLEAALRRQSAAFRLAYAAGLDKNASSFPVTLRH